MEHLKLFESFSQNIITDKDWDRMLSLYLANKDGATVARAITHKTKAIARFVSGLKLAGETPKPPTYNMNRFSDFAEKAISLGATQEEIQEVFDNTEIPQKYLDKISTSKNKKMSDRFVGDLAKKITDSGYDIVFLRSGNALTWEGKEAMERNGRKWTIGYKSEITLSNGKKMPLDFDAITDEGDGPTYYTIHHTSFETFKYGGYKSKMGKREFINFVMEKIVKENEKH
jgi:hypothetical protein